MSRELFFQVRLRSIFRSFDVDVVVVDVIGPKARLIKTFRF